MACHGLESVKGLRVVATGWIKLSNAHIPRRELARVLRRHGAIFQDEFNSETQVVIFGEWRTHQLQDDRTGGVDALDQVALSREQRGPHVHLISDDDLVSLLAGEHVRCRRITDKWVAMRKEGRRPTTRKRPYD